MIFQFQILMNVQMVYMIVMLMQPVLTQKDPISVLAKMGSQAMDLLVKKKVYII